MIKRYPPNRMLSILFILLLMAAYFSYDLYSRDQSSHARQAKPPIKNQLPEKVNLEKNNQNIPSPSPNAEVQGNRPESVMIHPGAAIILEKKYLKCGHTIRTKLTVPNDLVNMSKEQLETAYKNYQITKFNSDEIVLSQNINSKCDNHFILKEKDGYIAVYYQKPIDGISLKEVTPLLVKNLPSKEKERLKEGIKVDSQEELAQTLEDLGS